MTFEFKIQNISNIDIYNKKKLAITHTFEMEDPEVLAKKGKLLVAVSIKTISEANLNSAIKVFLDTVKEDYYKATDETPLSALESAVSQGLRMLYSFKSTDEIHTLGSKELETEISLSSALIWNRVLYTNYYGGGVGYILRGSGIRDISSQNTSLNEIWTNSSILDTEDVIIIGTREFAKNFPANTIIENFNDIPSLIAENPERNLMAAIFIKLTSAKTNRNIERAGINLLRNISNKGGLTEKLSKIKDIIYKTEGLSDRFKIYQKKKVAPISSISGIIPTATGEVLKTGLTSGKRINRDRYRKSYKNIAKTTIGIILLSVISLGGYYAVTNKNENPTQLKVLNYSTINESGLKTEKEPVENSYKDLHTLVETPSDIIPTAFQIKDVNTIIFTNSANNALQTYSIKDKKSTKLADFTGPDFLKCDNKLCYLIDTQSLIVLEPKENANIDRYIIDKVGIINGINPYNNKVYILGGNTIYQKFLLSEDDPDIWIKDKTVLSKPMDLAIDGNVYVLDENKVIKFYGGKKIAEYDTSDRVSEGSDIEVDIRNLYILDRQKRTVYVFNKGTGEFVKEIALTDEFDPSIPEKIVIFEKDNTSSLYFLKNNKIFKVE